MIVWYILDIWNKNLRNAADLTTVKNLEDSLSDENFHALSEYSLHKNKLKVVVVAIVALITFFAIIFTFDFQNT